MTERHRADAEQQQVGERDDDPDPCGVRRGEQPYHQRDQPPPEDAFDEGRPRVMANGFVTELPETRTRSVKDR